MSRDSIMVLVGSILAVLFQLIVAPNIALFSAVPNFLLAFVLVIAIIRPSDSVLVVAFLLGLFFDLVGSGPVGSMAFLCVLAAFLASRVFMVLNNDTFFMPFIIIVVSILCVEILYSAFLLGLGFTADPIDAFVYRTLPCFMYDCLIAVLLYLPLSRLVSGGDAMAAGPKAGAPTTQPRLSTDTRRSVTKKKKYR